MNKAVGKSYRTTIDHFNFATGKVTQEESFMSAPGLIRTVAGLKELPKKAYEVREALNEVLKMAAEYGLVITMENVKQLPTSAGPNMGMGKYDSKINIRPSYEYARVFLDEMDRVKTHQKVLAEHKRISELVDTPFFYNYPAKVVRDNDADIILYFDKEGLPQIRVEAANNENGQKVVEPRSYSTETDDAFAGVLVLNNRITMFADKLSKLTYDHTIFDQWPWPMSAERQVMVDGLVYSISHDEVEPKTAVVGGIETFAMIGARGRCIQCDACGAEYNGGNGTTKAGPIRVYRGGDEDQMLEDAKALGWEQCSVDGHVEDHCPKCVAALKYYSTVLQYTVNIGKFSNVAKAQLAATTDRNFFRTYYVVPSIPDAGPFSTAKEIAEHLIELMKYDEKHSKSTEIHRVEDGKETTVSRTEPR